MALPDSWWRLFSAPNPAQRATLPPGGKGKPQSRRRDPGLTPVGAGLLLLNFSANQMKSWTSPRQPMPSARQQPPGAGRRTRHRSACARLAELGQQYRVGAQSGRRAGRAAAHASARCWFPARGAANQRVSAARTFSISTWVWTAICRRWRCAISCMIWKPDSAAIATRRACPAIRWCCSAIGCCTRPSWNCRIAICCSPGCSVRWPRSLRTCASRAADSG